MPLTPSHPAGTPAWADLMSHDAAASRAFYGAVLGWEFQVMGEEFGGYGLAAAGGHMVAGIGSQPSGSPMPTAWVLYLATDDADASAARVVELGGSVLMPAMDVGTQGRMFLAMDPSRAVFGVWQAGEHKGAGLWGEPGALAWCEVNTREPQRTRDFYTALTGLSAHRMPTDTMTYYTLHHGEAAVAGILGMTAEWGDMAPHWMLYFQVDDVRAAIDRVKAAGGKVHHGPFPTPYGQIAVCVDPQGAAFSLLQAPASS